MNRRAALVGLSAVGAAGVAGCAPGQQEVAGARTSAAPPPNAGPVGDPPSQVRLARLTRGVNLSHWFAQTELTAARFRSYVTAEDAERIKGMGLRHVRLPLDPLALFREAQPGTLNASTLPLLDAGLDLFLERDVAVVVDLHPEDAFKRRLNTDDAFVQAVSRFWGALARHLNARDPERLFLEVMNEPLVSTAPRWAAVQAQLLGAMREGAPRHTLVATGHQWSTVGELVQGRPALDRNVVYNFHLYDPHTFTHQGATWGDETWRHIKGLPYPSSPEAVAPVLQGLQDPRARTYVEAYGRERWDADRLEARVQQAVRWAGQHSGVRLTCNEFGVYRAVSPPEARLAWLRDARTILEKHSIGWAMWDYAAGFGVVREEGARRVPDEEVLRALGL